MYTYQILIEYVGTNFVGWQTQKNGHSVQEILQKSLKRLMKKNTIVFGSGRTDSGVHAIEQSAHFKTDFKIKDKITFMKSLNFFLLNHNVSVLNIKKKSDNFHSRHSAKKRFYKYLIICRSSPLTLDKRRAWHIKKKLDISLIKKGARILKKTKDFSTFRAASCGAKTPIKSLDQVSIKKTGNKIEIIFASRSFLQQQVRSMVGCLKYLGEGKWTIKKFREVAFSKERKYCAPPAPAYGLYLQRVKY